MEQTGARPPEERPSGSRGEASLEISNRVVRIHKRFHGRGPTKTHTSWYGDTITVVLQGGFTRAELTLIAAGDHDAVVSQRQSIQPLLRQPLIEAVEEVTGQRVMALVSGVQTTPPQVAVDVFVLESPEE